MENRMKGKRDTVEGGGETCEKERRRVRSKEIKREGEKMIERNRSGEKKR
jgi:hypothetical protein